MALTPISTDDLRRVVNIGAARDLTQATGYHTDKHELLQVLHETGFVEPFDWGSWVQEQAAGLLDDPAALDAADLDTLRRLVTAHIRMDRFADGHLDEVLASGYMDRAIERARQLLAAREGTAEPLA
ncbi:MAG TPA: DUF6508 domain-containing protein [Thermoanaerobaculia bacterium]|jgi:hypothetical protein